MRFDPACIDVVDMLDCLDIRNVSQATEVEVKFSCPFPNHAHGDQDASAYMNTETTAWFCHGCHEKGNAIHFTAKLLGVSPLDAINMLRERYQPGGINMDAVSVREEVRKILDAKDDPLPVLSSYDEGLLDEFSIDWHEAWEARQKTGSSHPACDYMFDRGFEPDTLEQWDFGYDPKGDRVTFAVRDELGRLVGIKARAYYDRQPKYLILGDRAGRRTRYGFGCYPKSLVVFGMDKATEWIEILLDDQAAHLIVCEGELNAVALWQMGYRNAVAINGSDLSATQAKIIRAYADSVTVFFDDDPAGRDGEEVVVEALSPFLPVKTVGPHEGDPADLSANEVERLLSEAVSSVVRRTMLRSQV